MSAKLREGQSKLISEQLALTQAKLKWSQCKSIEEKTLKKCGPEPTLKDFKTVYKTPKVVKKDPLPPPKSLGDCKIVKGAKEASCGGIKYVEKTERDFVGEIMDPDFDRPMNTHRDTKGLYDKTGHSPEVPPEALETATER